VQRTPATRPTAAKAVPLRRPTPLGVTAAGTPLPVAPLTPPPPTPPRPLHPVHTPTAPAQSPADTTSAPPVQRAFGRTTGALAAAAASTVASTLSRLRPHSSGHTPADPPPPPYSPPPPGNPPPHPGGHTTPPPAEDDRPPAYTAVPAGGFDPRELTDFQLDELVHRIIGRVTRLVRTELRMDRERIGRLRDPRA
ncbi:hypothetical protein RM812_40130, partial [Streptomyces sp. DSM 40712]|nr:hypothetical protein [Streptomyces sp. DSM 40712]